MLVCQVFACVALSVVAPTAHAEDTLSDAAWNANPGWGSRHEDRKHFARPEGQEGKFDTERHLNRRRTYRSFANEALNR